MTLVRLNGSQAPERLTTLKLAVSNVVKRRPHSGQERRRRIAAPSSVSRESTTRESGKRQNGQCTAFRLLSRPDPVRQHPVEAVWHNLWRKLQRCNTRCGGRTY